MHNSTPEFTRSSRLCELISFYTVGYDNNGKYLIKRTLPKRILQYSFHLFLAGYILIYAIFAVLVIVWSILGAIMNPSKYLA